MGKYEIFTPNENTKKKKRDEKNTRIVNDTFENTLFELKIKSE